MSKRLKNEPSIARVTSRAHFIANAEDPTPQKLIALILHDNNPSTLTNNMEKVAATKADKKAQLFVSGYLVKHAKKTKVMSPHLDRILLSFLDDNKSSQQRLILHLSHAEDTNIKRSDQPLAVFIHLPKVTDEDTQRINITLLFKQNLITLNWQKKQLEKMQCMKLGDSSNDVYKVTQMLGAAPMHIVNHGNKEHQTLLAMLRTLERCSEEEAPASTEPKEGVLNYIGHASEHGSHRIPAIVCLALSSAGALTGLILVPCIATVFAASLLAAGAPGIAAAIAAIVLIAAGAVGIALSAKQYKHSNDMQLGSQSILAPKPKDAGSAQKDNTP